MSACNDMTIIKNFLPGPPSRGKFPKVSFPRTQQNLYELDRKSKK